MHPFLIQMLFINHIDGEHSIVFLLIISNFRCTATCTCSRGCCGTRSAQPVCRPTRIHRSISVARPLTWPTRAPTPPLRLLSLAAAASPQETPIHSWWCGRARAIRRPPRADRTRSRHLKTTRLCSTPRTLSHCSSPATFVCAMCSLKNLVFFISL